MVRQIAGISAQGAIIVRSEQAGINIAIAVVPEKWIIAPAPPGIIIEIIISVRPEHRTDPTEAAMGMAPPQVSILMILAGSRGGGHDGGARIWISQSAWPAQGVRIGGEDSERPTALALRCMMRFGAT